MPLTFIKQIHRNNMLFYILFFLHAIYFNHQNLLLQAFEYPRDNISQSTISEIQMVHHGNCCSDLVNARKGSWSPQEDQLLTNYVMTQHDKFSWVSVPKQAGLNRCGRSCRLRWKNYLNPKLKRGPFTTDEVQLLDFLHDVLGNKWAEITRHFPGRTDNEIKNFWNTRNRERHIVPNNAAVMDQNVLIDNEGHDDEEYVSVMDVLKDLSNGEIDENLIEIGVQTAEQEADETDWVSVDETMVDDEIDWDSFETIVGDVI